MSYLRIRDATQELPVFRHIGISGHSTAALDREGEPVEV